MPDEDRMVLARADIIVAIRIKTARTPVGVAAGMLHQCGVGAQDGAPGQDVTPGIADGRAVVRLMHFDGGGRGPSG